MINIDAILTNADWPKRTPDHFADLVQKFDPSQPRDPKGSSTGGRFAKAQARQLEFLEQHGIQATPVNTPAKVMRERPLPSTLADAEDRIRYEMNEHAFLTKQGKPFAYLGSNDPNHIRFGGWVSHSELKDAVFTHNHPSGFGLSNRDGVSAAKWNMLEMRAVTPTGTHIIRRTGTDWPSHFDEAISDMHGSLMEELGMQLHEGEITAAEANKQHHILMYRRLQQMVGGFVYTFEPKA